MKKTIIILVITLLTIILASCKTPDLPSSEGNSQLLQGANTFYAKNMVKDSFYEVTAEKLYEGAKCIIWAENGSGVTEAQAKEIANEYDSRIRHLIIDTFSKKNFTYQGYSFRDMLDFANQFAGNNNDKLTILLLDIKDKYVEGTNNSFIAGYFSPIDLYSKKDYAYSNGRDMIYIDTNPGLNKDYLPQTYATLAHELQHLVNFVTTVEKNRVDSGNYLILTDVWVNEGLSAYAEYLYLGGHPADKIGWLQNERNTINKGNNFFVWDNHEDDLGPMAILDEYATVYLFFQWLYLQADTELRSHIFRDIAYSPSPDYQAITSVMEDTWENLLKKWLAANCNPGDSDYGYKGDTALQAVIKIDPIAVSGDKVSLYPGEGVYSKISGSYSPPASEGNIRYETLVNTLLTFNASTDKSASPETGSLTGVAASVTVSPTAANNARSAAKQNKPYVIDARDLLGRDKEEIKFRLPR